MFRVEMYFQVRRACLVEGMSVREASRVFGLHRDTVGKMLANATPQGYTRQRPPRKPKIEHFTGVIDAILEADRHVPKNQRHTVKRIFERLRDEYGFEGQHTIVKDYVREHRRRVGEMFVPLTHGPGHAQCDFGEAVAVVAGVEQKIHYFVLDLPHSDGCFVKAYPRGDHGGLSRRPRLGLRLPGRFSPEHPVRQYQAGGGQDTGLRSAQTHASFHRAAVPLPVRGPVRSSQQGK